MRVVNTHEMGPSDLGPWERLQVYCGLDVCTTSEVLNVIRPQLDNLTAGTYAFSMALQGPCLEMRLRGVRVDQRRKAEVIDLYYDQLDRLERNLDRIVLEGVGLPTFNWRSNPDLIKLFYGALGIPEIRKKHRVTVDRDALEKMEFYLVAKPAISHIKALRDIAKKISFLKTGIDPDGRLRTSFNIAGTTTGRLSSSFTEFGTGGNLQNVEESLRSVVIADPGMKLGYFDAEQGESRVVGAIEWNLFSDPRYLDACESGDLHTAVAKLVWPGLNWPDNLKEAKEIAEKPFYRHYSRRFMCKKIGHGTNYGGKPQTLSNQAKVEIGLITDFQPKYFKAFPAHLRWHAWTKRELHQSGTIISLMSRKRQFWGRRDSDETFREAVAFQGQALADIVNQGMLNVWRARDCQLLMQIHDAILVQYPEEREDEIVPKILSQLRYPIPLAQGREFVIPYGCKTGWNWGNYNENNPDGLKDYRGSDKRTRTKETHILDRLVC